MINRVIITRTYICEDCGREIKRTCSKGSVHFCRECGYAHQKIKQNERNALSNLNGKIDAAEKSIYHHQERILSALGQIIELYKAKDEVCKFTPEFEARLAKVGVYLKRQEVV
jgi:uncharacterized protein YPO0396